MLIVRIEYIDALRPFIWQTHNTIINSVPLVSTVLNEDIQQTNCYSHQMNVGLEKNKASL